jgi:hypothetical protein
VRRKFWLQGESSLYTPKLRGGLGKLTQIRPFGIAKEALRGLKREQ